MELLHNQRCGKSRNCLAFLEENKKEFTVIKYLENPLTIDEIKDLLSKLKLSPIELVRQKERLWIDQYKNRELTKNDIIKAMADHPILIERPIVIIGANAYIARDIESLNKLI
ncbi:ArsC/Spx/MgsR family protein [Flavobacterium sp.]